MLGFRAVASFPIADGLAHPIYRGGAEWCVCGLFNFELGLPSIFVWGYVSGFSYFNFRDFVICVFFYFVYDFLFFAEAVVENYSSFF